MDHDITHSLVVIDRNPRLREQFLLIALFDPFLDCPQIRIPLHSKLANEAGSEYIPVMPRFLRSMPDIPLMSIADRLVGGRLAAIRT